ncbi:alpha/beta hydrolase [Burkholderia cepacia]|uniref:Alpha/beta hydrolase n=1 Tax=Burkholderia cepacia TaxID=292 RepID=A0A2S8IYT6_BURCE|nr:alpha/beta hydrolase [Burkholderia cepacia]PQP19964.1 alpha/beta hydrolase [Burkholderia cepacia]HDR9506581.1 alpha/beta hydrolase [Burkholderia cepacia]
MNQKFSGDVGQVAGGDVKSNSAQTNVNLHFHGAESKSAVTKFISDRQRNAIARKAFEIQEKTGTDKLMVYRRLMTVFDFERMDEMPRTVYERAIKYLDGWIRNGTLGQAPGAPAQREDQEPAPDAPELAVHSESQLERRTPSAVTATAPAQHRSKRSPWLAVSIAAIAAMAVAAVLTVVAPRPDAPAQTQAAEPPQHCEYDGNRYSPGGVVMQAGIRQQCVADAERGARWERAPGARR